MKRKQRGQTLVEMAMISPFLIMILLMVIDCGRAAYAYSTLAGVARDGARVAITTGSNRPDNPRVIGAVQQNAYGVQLNPGTCINDAPPATPTMSPNTGLNHTPLNVAPAGNDPWATLAVLDGAWEPPQAARGAIAPRARRRASVVRFMALAG